MRRTQITTNPAQGQKLWFALAWWCSGVVAYGVVGRAYERACGRDVQVCGRVERGDVHLQIRCQRSLDRAVRYPEQIVYAADVLGAV